MSKRVAATVDSLDANTSETSDDLPTNAYDGKATKRRPA